MAGPVGKADKLKDWFFVHQDELSPATVRTAAADVGGVANFDAQYPQVLQTVKADVAVGTSLGVDSTPTFFVNGRRIPGGGLPPQYFAHLIDLELKRAK
jgi:protein-disulfide isomerase